MEIEFKKMPVLIVRKNSPAMKAFVRMAGEMKPGTIHFVSDEEFESLKEDVVAFIDG